MIQHVLGGMLTLLSMSVLTFAQDIATCNICDVIQQWEDSAFQTHLQIPPNISLETFLTAAQSISNHLDQQSQLFLETETNFTVTLEGITFNKTLIWNGFQEKFCGFDQYSNCSVMITYNFSNTTMKHSYLRALNSITRAEIEIIRRMPLNTPLNQVNISLVDIDQVFNSTLDLIYIISEEIQQKNTIDVKWWDSPSMIGSSIEETVKKIVQVVVDTIQIQQPNFDSSSIVIKDTSTRTPTFTPTSNIQTYVPTRIPTNAPSNAPTDAPTEAPTGAPTDAPTDAPTGAPTDAQSGAPTGAPTYAPTLKPCKKLLLKNKRTCIKRPDCKWNGKKCLEVDTSSSKANVPTRNPTNAPSNAPTDYPTGAPTDAPTDTPTSAPTDTPTSAPTDTPTGAPTDTPTGAPTDAPTNAPTETPTIPNQTNPPSTESTLNQLSVTNTPTPSSFLIVRPTSVQSGLAVGWIVLLVIVIVILVAVILIVTINKCRSKESTETETNGLLANDSLKMQAIHRVKQL